MFLDNKKIKNFIDSYYTNESIIIKLLDSKYYNDDKITIPEIPLQLFDSNIFFINNVIKCKHRFVSQNYIKDVFEEIVKENFTAILLGTLKNQVFILTIVFDIYQNKFIKQDFIVYNSFKKSRFKDFKLFNQSSITEKITNYDFYYKINNDILPYIFIGIIFYAENN